MPRDDDGSFTPAKDGDGMKHTPGPWKVTDGKTLGTLIEAKPYRDGYIVARVNSTKGMAPDGDENREANANLIAAAPEMLEALKTIYVDACDREETEDDDGEEYEDYKAARVVLEKVGAI